MGGWMDGGSDEKEEVKERVSLAISFSSVTSVWACYVGTGSLHWMMKEKVHKYIDRRENRPERVIKNKEENTELLIYIN